MAKIFIDFDATDPEARFVLMRARSLIADPENWIQGPVAVDKDKKPVEVGDPDACAWCALGAIYEAAYRNDAPDEPAYDVLRKIILGAGYGGIANWNDWHKTTHSEVLDVFDEAIDIVTVPPTD